MQAAVVAQLREYSGQPAIGMAWRVGAGGDAVGVTDARACDQRQNKGTNLAGAVVQVADGGGQI